MDFWPKFPFLTKIWIFEQKFNLLQIFDKFPTIRTLNYGKLQSRYFMPKNNNCTFLRFFWRSAIIYSKKYYFCIWCKYFIKTPPKCIKVYLLTRSKWLKITILSLSYFLPSFFYSEQFSAFSGQTNDFLISLKINKIKQFFKFWKISFYF